MTAVADKVDALRGVRLFRDLNATHLRKVARVADMIEVRAGKEVVVEGTYRAGGPPAFFVIIDGQAEVTKKRKRLSRLKAGDTFGELSLLDGKPRAATVRATTDLQLLRIRSYDFTRLLKTEPTIALELLRVVGSRLRALEDTLR